MLCESPQELEVTAGLLTVSQIALCMAVKTDAWALPVAAVDPDPL